MGGVSHYKEDVIFGLAGGDCQQRYKDCSDSLWQLLLNSEPVRYLMKIRNQQQKKEQEDVLTF